MKNTRRSLLTSCVSLLLCFVMLLGTTFAWFTDVAISSGNVIQTGNLDIDLVKGTKTDTGWDWESTDGKAIFDYDKWEPGYTATAVLGVENNGSLSAKWTAKLNLNGDPTILADVIEIYVTSYHNYSTERPDFTDGNWQKLGTVRDVLNNNGVLLPGGTIDPGDRQPILVALHMREDAGNSYQDLKLGANFDIQILATQASVENDSFGNNYDADAEWPNIPSVGNSASANVTLNPDNTLAEEVTMTSADGRISATLPAGTKLQPGTTSVKLVVADKEKSEANLTLDENQASLSLDVHITGIADDNDKAIKVELGEVLPTGLNLGNHSLYHVEDGQTVGMTLLDATVGASHNTYAYDPATGEVIVYMASFSEVALVADTENEWKGKVDYTWYNNSTIETINDVETIVYTIANADQLAAFGKIVGFMAEDIEGDNFTGKLVRLISDINLGDKNNANENLIFYPIGYYYTDDYNKDGTTGDYYSTVSNFSGTFDGNGHTIANFYQNTWEIKGDYDGNYYKDAMGLFGYVHGGTVKNLTVDSFSSDGEFTPTGVIAAYADGNSTFENIAIFNCNPRVYNTGNGGIIGIAGDTSSANDDHMILRNITVDNSNKITALWGSWDVACGGLVGMYRGNVDGNGNATLDTIKFENCHVSAQIDVYNDVCANYQYYAYRYSGMIIGSVRHNTTNTDGKSIPDMTGISASGCTVHFGTWNDYYYCEIIDNTTASYTHDYQMSRLTEIKAINGNTITYLDGTTGTVPASGRANYVIVDYSKGHGTENATCYHFKDGEVWTHDMGGIQTGIDENGDGKDDLKEDKQHLYLEFNNLFTGYGWGVSSMGINKWNGITALDVTQGEHEESINKFTPKIENGAEISTESTVNIGDLFAAIDKLDVAINTENVQVSVSPFGATSTAGGTYTANAEDWTKGTLTFSGVGQAVITITDYYFCKTTSITVNIAADKFGTNFVNYEKYLYRVGNQNAVTLGTIFKALEGANIDSSSVKIDFATIAGTAAGTHSENTTDWTNGTIQFAGTGVVKVIVSAANANDFVLHLEVVNAENLTSAKGYTGTEHKNFVLVKDISTSSFVNHWNCTIYGNGFTYSLNGAPTTYNSKQGHGILITKNATLDNLVIIGDVYNSYGAYTSQDYYTAAIDATNTTIQNSYIANCSTPVRGNGVTITNTTLYGGTVANLILSGGVNTLTDLITVNYNDGRGVLGLGIVVPNEAADTTKIVLEGTLKQYNYVCSSDSSVVPGEEAKAVFNSMFDDSFNAYKTSAGYVNTGIIIMTKSLNTDIITDNANTGYLANDDATVKVTATGLTTTVNGAIYAPKGDGASVDNGYSFATDTHVSTTQGDYLPTPNFNLGTQAVTGEDTYLKGDINGVEVRYIQGETPLTLDISKLMTVFKYEGVNYTVNAVFKDSNGSVVVTNGTVTFNTAGSYTLVFTVEDNMFYNADGTKSSKSVTRTYEVPISVVIAEPAIADAVITVNKTALDGGYNERIGDRSYKFNPLNAITITDAEGTVNLTTNIASTNIVYASSSSAFAGATTITVTYTDGRILKIVLGKPSLNSPGSSKAITYANDGTIKSAAKVASKSATGGTWTVTSYSFTGTNGKTVTNNTVVTFTFPDQSCVTGDTMVMLADGTQKRIDQVTYEDQLLVWNFFTGKYDVVPSAIIFYHGDAEYDVLNLKFSDGTVVKVINNHGFFDIEENRFVFIDNGNVEYYVGHHFAKVDEMDATSVKLIDYEITQEYTGCYSIQSAMHNNFMVEGMFSLTIPHYEGWFDYFEIGEGMKYDEEKMQADIEKYGLYTYEEFAEYVTYEQFMAFNGPYLKVLVGRGVVTYDQIIELISMYVNPEN